MKTHIKTLFAASLAVLAASCTDLDTEVKSQYTSYPQSDIAIEAALASTFYSMRGSIGRSLYVISTLSSDEAVGVSMDGDYTDSYRWMGPTVHDFRSSNEDLGSIWADATSGITNCNTALNLLNDDESNGAAQVRAARAYYHFVLMDCFGDVPILTRDADAAPARAKRAEVAKFIESELKAVLDKLPVNVDETTYGKPTRYMAEALLAKLYLNWPVYTADDVQNYTPTASNEKLNDLVTVCDDIIKSGKFDLSDAYRTKFYANNGPQIKDFIYAMPFDHDTQKGMSYARWWTHRSAQKEFYGVDLPKSVAGNFRLNPEYVDKFNLQGDDRNAVILGGDLYVRNPNTYDATTTRWTVSGTPVTLTKTIKLTDNSTLNTGNDLNGRSQGYRCIKFYADLTAPDRDQSNDVPIFRYADVLLMKAEAILRGATATNGDTPMSLMNQIRTYVHAPLLTAAPTLDDLLDERAREFIDELWRRNDLIRYGKFEEDWGFKRYSEKGDPESKHYRIFPLPDSALETNTQWSQNADY